MRSSLEAPPTTLVHTFYDSPWQALPGSPALVNRVMFGRFAVKIERNFAHARSRGVEPQTGNPTVLVIAYLLRHAQSLREYLTTFFEHRPSFNKLLRSVLLASRWCCLAALVA